jgi:AraC-like DNA-binding protein
VTGLVRRRQLERGWTENASRLPHPLLRSYASRYWGYVERYREPMRRRELPSSEVVVILSFGPELRLLHAGHAGPLRSHTSLVAGLTEASVVTEMDGASHGMQVNLTPIGAHRFFRIPMDAVTNRIVAFDDILGAEAGELLERLHAAGGWSERFDLLDTALLSRLAGAVPSPEVEWVWQRLTASDGRVRVASLTEELGWSRKRLIASFREQVGLKPKTTARVLRFERAVRLIEDGDRRSWAELALDCGYYDQAHFNRDFRQFAGSTPTDFLARQIPEGLGLAPE